VIPLTRCQAIVSATIVPFSALRDQLARDDRMQLALEIAQRCQIEATPVWAAWGRLKLRMGQYNAARDKFKQYFGGVPSRLCTMGR